MKNMKMKTKLILGFMVPIMITVINILISDLTTKWVASISDPAEQQIFTRIATISTLIFAVISVVITVCIALALIKIIEKSVKQLSDAAKEIAMGHVNINLVKYNNDLVTW